MTFLFLFHLLFYVYNISPSFCVSYKTRVYIMRGKERSSLGPRFKIILNYIILSVRIVRKQGDDIMAGAITVTPEQLKSQAKIYQTASSQIEDAIRKVNSMNSTIAQEWQGEAFRAYLEQYKQLEGNVKQMENLLQSIHMQLTKYADTVADRDRQDAGSFGLN